MSAADPEVFRLAAKILREEGWCQGNYTKYKWSMTEDGYSEEILGRCALGAIGAAVKRLRKEKETWLTGPVENLPEASFLARHLHELPELWGAVARWNDIPGRTVDEVILELEACAEEAAREKA